MESQPHKEQQVYKDQQALQGQQVVKVLRVYKEAPGYQVLLANKEAQALPGQQAQLELVRLAPKEILEQQEPKEMMEQQEPKVSRELQPLRDLLDQLGLLDQLVHRVRVGLALLALLVLLGHKVLQV